MGTKQWRNLGIAAVVLVALYLITQIRESRHTVGSDRVFDIDQEKVGRIAMADDMGQAELVRDDTSWTLAGYPDRTLKQWRLDNVLRSVIGVEKESIISTNPDKWATFGVDSTGKQVLVYSTKDKLVGHIWVGQSKTNWQSSTIREEGEDEVSMTSQSIFHLIGTDTTFWLEPLPEPDTTGVEES